MNIHTEKLQFMEQYMKLKDETIIEKLSETLKAEISKLKRIPVTEKEKQAIKQGLEDIEEGRTHTHEEVMAKMLKKYPKLVK